MEAPHFSARALMVDPAEQGLKLQILAAVLLAVLLFLHYLLWVDENGVRQTRALRIYHYRAERQQCGIVRAQQGSGSRNQGFERRTDGD